MSSEEYCIMRNSDLAKYPDHLPIMVSGSLQELRDMDTLPPAAPDVTRKRTDYDWTKIADIFPKDPATSEKVACGIYHVVKKA